MIVFEREGVEYSVEFPNRCFFCFVKLTSDFNVESVDVDKSAQFQVPVNDFQEVFNHLVHHNEKDIKFIEQVPPICSTCGSLLEALQSALNRLVSVTNAVKSRIRNLGNDAINKELRLHDFSLDLQKIPAELGKFQELLNLLEKIGHGPFENIQTLYFQENVFEEHFLGEDEDGESCEWTKDEFNNDSKPEDIDWLLQKELEKCGRETNSEIKPSIPMDAQSGGEPSTEDVEMGEELIPVSFQKQDGVDPLSDYGTGDRFCKILPKPDNNALLQAPEETPSHSRVGNSFVVVETGRLAPPRILVPRKKGKHLKGSPRGCDVCGEQVYMRNILGHVRSHVGEYAIPCPNPGCKVVFSNFHSLKAHSHYSLSCCQLVKKVTSTCNICGHHAPTIKHLRLHLDAEHETTQKLYPCPVAGCSASFTVRQSVQCHLNVHTISSNADMAPPFFQTCPECGTHIPQPMLRQHLVNEHGTPPESIVQCKHCPYLFPAWDKFINHLGIHMKAGTPISCDLCPAGESFKQIPLLKKHYLAVHKVNCYEFVCEHCHKPFHELRCYRRHLKTHSGDIPPLAAKTGTEPKGSAPTPLPVIGPRSDKYACDYCGKQVPSCNLVEHLRGHVGDYVLTCENPVCGSVFGTLSHFKRHMEVHTSCVPFATKSIDKCELCGHQAKNIQGLRGHLIVVHETADKPFSCPVANCPERFTFRQSVYCHVNNHATVNKKQKLAPPSFQTCPACTHEVPQDKIREHLETMHEIHSDSIISCKYCPYLFPSRDKLLDHLAVHINSGTPVSCDMCGDESKYAHMRGLRHHYKTAHKVERARQFVCDVCSKAFQSARALQGHAKNRHTGVEKSIKKVKCAECPDEEFKDERALMGHKIRFHGAEPFKCQFCGNEFDSWAPFVRHENEHKGISTVKVFKCDIDGCGKVFNQKKSLDYHQKSVEHVGQTNAFVCGQCGKGFNHEANLKDHEKHVHTTERKFVCDECGESFKRAEILKKHKMIHTGEKPYHCDICQQRFRYKEVLRRHVEGHEKKGTAFRPNGPMKNVRKRVNPK